METVKAKINKSGITKSQREVVIVMTKTVRELATLWVKYSEGLEKLDENGDRNFIGFMNFLAIKKLEEDEEK